MLQGKDSKMWKFGRVQLGDFDLEKGFTEWTLVQKREIVLQIVVVYPWNFVNELSI